MKRLRESRHITIAGRVDPAVLGYGVGRARRNANALSQIRVANTRALHKRTDDRQIDIVHDTLTGPLTAHSLLALPAPAPRRQAPRSASRRDQPNRPAIALSAPTNSPARVASRRDRPKAQQ